MRFGRRGAVAAVLIIVLLAGLTACEVRTGRSQSPRPAHAPRPAHGLLRARPRTSALGLLRESWASNGSRGYFIDTGAAPSAAVSLYDTAWWSSAKAASGHPAAHLVAGKVAKWLRPLLYGAPGSAGSADTAGLPRLEVIDAAAVLARTANIGIDGAAVARSLARLRAGDQYRSELGARHGDWASTSLAVAILSMVGQRPPPAVAAGLTAQVGTALSSRNPARLFSVTIPVLSVMTDAQTRAAGPALRHQLARIAHLLPGMNSLERVTAASELRHLVAISGGRAWPAAVICADLRDSGGGVAFGPGTAVDPQLTAEAVLAGCHVKVSAPPWTAAGWPDEQASSTAPQASVSGLRIAARLGVANRYRRLVAAQLTTVWLPSAARGHGASDILSLELVARLCGIPMPAPQGLARMVMAALPQPASPATLPVLLAGLVAGVRPGRGAAGEAGWARAGPDIFSAAAEEAKYRLTRVAFLHRAAEHIVARLAVGSGLYSYSPARAQRGQPSVVATAIADWVTGQDLPREVLVRAGLCDRRDSCGSTGPDSPVDSLLRATAAVAVMTGQDRLSFPVAL